MILTQILQNIPTVAVSGSTAIDIKGISFDSRTCAPGWLFVAVNGTEASVMPSKICSAVLSAISSLAFFNRCI